MQALPPQAAKPASHTKHLTACGSEVSRRRKTMQKITIGDVEIIAVTDGTGLVLALDQTFPTIQPAQWEPYFQRYPRVFTNSSNWYLHYGCFVVRTREHTLLVDTGVGPGPYMGVVYG